MSDEGGKRKTRSLNLETKHHLVQTAVISKPCGTRTWAEGWADRGAGAPGSKATFSAPVGHGWAFHSGRDTKDIDVVRCGYATLSSLVHQMCLRAYTHTELRGSPQSGRKEG